MAHPKSTSSWKGMSQDDTCCVPRPWAPDLKPDSLFAWMLQALPTQRLSVQQFRTLLCLPEPALFPGAPVPARPSKTNFLAWKGLFVIPPGQDYLAK